MLVAFWGTHHLLMFVNSWRKTLVSNMWELKVLQSLRRHPLKLDEETLKLVDSVQEVLSPSSNAEDSKNQGSSLTKNQCNHWSVFVVYTMMVCAFWTYTDLWLDLHKWAVVDRLNELIWKGFNTCTHTHTHIHTNRRRERERKRKKLHGFCLNSITWSRLLLWIMLLLVLLRFCTTTFGFLLSFKF